MAKDAKPEADAEQAPPPKRSKKLVIIVVAALVVVLAIAGAAAYMVVRNQRAPDGEDGDAAIESAQLEKKKNGKAAVPVYVPLEAFTVNLVPENGDQFLQLVMAIEVADGQVGDRIKTYTPKLRNNVVLLLSSKKASELITREGKETLANEIRDLINDVLAAGTKGPDLPVREVLFTSFIIQ